MLVTNSGCVHSFEPNPKCCRRIRELLEINEIKHVKLHEVGLSDQAETITLSVIADHTDMGTLASPQDNYT
jgi:FkbM family methyltransferase